MRVVILILLIAALSLNTLNVGALAVASDYLEDETLEVIDGTSKIYSIRLQNPDEYEMRVKVDYSKEFMKASDFKEEYTLPPKSSTRIEFNITAPKYDKNNNLFTLGYTIHQLSGGPGGGGIPFLEKINKNFNLRVIKSPKKFYIDYNLLVYAAMALAFLLYISRKKISGYFGKKQKNKLKNRKIIK